MKPEHYRVDLEIKSNDELRYLAKKVELVGYSGLKKSELIDLIFMVKLEKLKKEIYPSWWLHYHNQGINRVRLD